MTLANEFHLDICRTIEVGLKAEYQKHRELTDTLCAFGLESAIVATKQAYGFARKEKVPAHPLVRGIIEGCVSLSAELIGGDNQLSLKDYLACIEKVRKSVVRHSASGPRAYYDFIKNHV